MGKKKERPDAEGYNYMDTYGDLVTLLLTFFVLLYSFSSVDEGKWELLVETFTGTNPSAAISMELTPVNTGGTSFTEDTSGMTDEEGQGDTNLNPGVANTQEEVNQNFDQLYEQVQEYIQENNLELSLVAEKIDDVIIVRVLDGVLFESGKAEVIQDENQILVDIANMLSTSEKIVSMVRVEGHTDNVPISNGQFQDNWDLSAKRGTNVIRYIYTTTNFPASKLNLGGGGEYQPIASNDTAEGRQQNRRVNFIIERVVVDQP